MRITKDDKGYLISVKDQNGKVFEKDGINYGDVENLNLGPAHENNPIEQEYKFRQDLFDIPNDTVIHTHSSPGCTWYFYNRQWYRVCS
jgi:hypothetical protein